MKRRDFLVASALVLASGKMLTEECVKYHQRSLEEHIYNELPKHVHMAETKSRVKYKYGTKEIEEFKETKGCGVIYKGHYITLAHITDMSVIPKRTMMGIMFMPVEVIETNTRLYSTDLELVHQDRESDIAVFKLPKYFNVPEFPAEPETKPFLGQKAYIIGNPRLSGTNIRETQISDIDGNKGLPGTTKNYIGIDSILISGDSGSPTVTENGKLLGLNAFYFNGLGYINPIINFDKYITKDDTEATKQKPRGLHLDFWK